MRNNQPVTGKAYRFPADQTLISVTDLKGRITYGNRIFIEYSGYTEEELLELMNNTPYGLSASLWTNDLGKALHLGEKQLYVGVEYDYWKNKYGIKDSDAFTTDQNTMSFLVKVHF